MADIPLRVLLTLVDQLSQPFRKATTDMEKSSGSLTEAAGDMGKRFSGVFMGIAQGAGMAAGQFLLQTPHMIGEFVKLGAQAEAAEYRFTAFAGGADQASQHMAAFQTATDGTISRMDAMSGASRLLQMGLVGNADEMGQVAAMATKLGDQTLGAGERLSGFSALLANQSIPRLDDYGISSGRVRERIKELQAATADMSREEAFKIAVMEEGAKALDTLGDTGDLASTKIAKLRAAGEDAKVGFAEMALSALDAVGSVDDLADTIRNLPQNIQKSTKAFGDAEAAHWSGRDAIVAYNNAMLVSSELLKQQAQEAQAWAGAWETHKLDQYSEGLTGAEVAAHDLEVRMWKIDQVEKEYLAGQSAQDYVENLANLGSQAEEAIVDMYDMASSLDTVDAALDGAAQEAEAYAQKMADLAVATQNAALDMAMSWTDYHERQAEQVAEHTANREALETEHQARMTELQATGNAEAIAAEQARYQEELALMQAAQAEQEAAQRESLGRMVLQQFDSWASMNEISGTQAVEMRMAIMQEYGLIDQESMAVVDSMLGTWDAWASGTAGSAKDAIASIDGVVDGYGDMAKAHEMDVGDMVDAEESSYKDRAKVQDDTLADMASTESGYYSDRLRLQDDSLSDEESADETFFSDKLRLQDDSLTEAMSTEETYFSDRARLQDSSLSDSARGWETYFSDLLRTQDRNFSTMARAEADRHAQQLRDERTTLDDLLRMIDVAWTGISDVVGDQTAIMQDRVDDSHRNIQRAVENATRDVEDSWSMSSDRVRAQIDNMIAKIDELNARLDSIPRQIDVDIFIHVHGTAPEEAGDQMGGLGLWEGWPSIDPSQAEMAHQNLFMVWSEFYERRAEQDAQHVAELQELETDHQARMAELLAQGNAEAIAAEQARYAEELAMMQAGQAEQEAAQREALGRMVLQQFDAYASMSGMTGMRMLEMRLAIMSEYDLIDQASIDTVNAMAQYWDTWASGAEGSASDYISGLDDIIDAQGDMVDVQGDAMGDMAAATAAGYGSQAATQEAMMSTMVGTTEDGYGIMLDATDESMMSIQDGWTATSDHVGGKVDDIVLEVDRLNAALDSIRTNIDVYINVHPDTVPSYQHGTTYHPGGLALMGEGGPELAWLPAGAQVFPSYDPRSMTAARRGPPGTSAGPATSPIHIWGPVHIHGVQDPLNLVEEIQALAP